MDRASARDQHAREVVSEFIERGADVHARNAMTGIGWTDEDSLQRWPRGFATHGEVTAEFRSRAAADAHARDKVGGTPLQLG